MFGGLSFMNISKWMSFFFFWYHSEKFTTFFFFFLRWIKNKETLIQSPPVLGFGFGRQIKLSTWSFNEHWRIETRGLFCIRSADLKVKIWMKMRIALFNVQQHIGPRHSILSIWIMMINVPILKIEWLR